jgi:GNAT superfamily N-acetyltransferase
MTEHQAAEELRIRTATPADRNFILSLAPRLAGPSRLAWRDSERLDRFTMLGLQETVTAAEDAGHEPTEAVLIAEAAIDGRPLGLIHVKGDVSVLTDEPQGYIAILAVTTEAEGQGIGRALMAAAEAWARERGYRYLALDTFATNSHARAFYARLGFAEESLKMVKPL